MAQDSFDLMLGSIPAAPSAAPAAAPAAPSSGARAPAAAAPAPEAFDLMLNSIPGAPAASAGAAPGVEGFVSQYGPLAQRVGERLGVAPEALLGQWGLETGWGKSVIPGTNNLGNIKDFSKRADSVYAVDNQTKTNDAYRRFGTEDEFGDHFADLLTRRYGGALKAGDDSQRFFSALKNGGYAEDKDYVAKGVRAANMAAAAMGRSGNPLVTRGAASPTGSAATGARVPGEYHDPYSDIETPARRSNMQVAKDAFQSGFESSKGLGASFAALLSSTLGNDPHAGLTKELLDYSEGQSQKAAKLQGDAASFTDAIGEGGDLGRWAANAAGYLGYQVGEAILTGGVGGVIGKTIGKKAVGTLASGMVEKEIGRLAATDAAKDMTKEQVAALAAGKVASQLTAAGAIFANNVRQEGGSIYSDALEEQSKDPTKQADLGRVWLASLAAAGIDTAADVAMAKGVLGMKEGSTAASYAGRAAREIPKNMAVQGGTEAVQTAIEQVGAKKEVGTPDSIKDIVDSAAIGALGGAGGGVASAVHKRTAELAPVADAAAQPGNAISRAAMAGNTPEALAAGAQQQATADQQQAAADAPKADPLAERTASVVAAARAPGVTDALRNEGSPADVKKFVADLAIAQSPSTPAAAREQALSRLEFALEWAGQSVPAAPATNIDAVAGTQDVGNGVPRSEPTTPEQRRAGADRDAQLQGQANAAGTDFERQNALAQAQTNREQRMGAPAPAAAPAAAVDPVRSFAERIAKGDRPSTPEDIQFYQNNAAAIEAELGRLSAGAPERDATRQRKLEESALAGKDANRKAEDDPRQLVINRAMRAIEERGGVASPAEAKIVQEAGLGKPYDRIDETLAPPLSTDEKLTQATGIALDRAPRETTRYSTNPTDEAAAEEKARQDAQDRANARGTAQVGQGSRQGPQPQPQAVSAPERPAAQQVIDALARAPALRTADDRVTIQAAQRGYTDEEMAILRNAGTAPFNLTASDKVRLEALRAPAAERSVERGAAAPAPAAGRDIDTPAVFRKRKETLRQLARSGFTKVERRADGFYLLGRPGQEFKLDGPADAQLARTALHDVVREGANSGNTNPTDAQKEQNNYKLGRVEFDGLKLGIENPIGTERSGTAPDGTKWAVSMTAHYGDVTGTKGRDGDALDVYLVDNPRHGAPVFVIDQYNDDGKFDETKTVLGATTQAQAEAVYDAHFSDGSGPRRRGAVTQMTTDEFKAWANSSKSTQPAGGLVQRAVATAPAAAEGSGKVRVNVDGETKQLDLVKNLPEVESLDRGGKAVRVSKKKGALLEALGAAFGKKVVFFDDASQNIGDGFILDNDPNTIFLNQSTGISPLAVFGHELTHQLKRDNPAAHAALESVVAERLKGGAQQRYLDLGYKPGQVLEEITSDLGGDLMSDQTFWRDVLAKIQTDNGGDARGIVAKLAEFLYRALNTLTRNMRSYGATELVNDADAVREAFKGAMADYLQTNGIAKQSMQADIMRAGQEAKRSVERNEKAAADRADLRAPNGQKSKLTPEQYDAVRTPEFKRWFGDWEKFAALEGGVWNDDKGVVSKAVDKETGEPLVLYHGTDSGGFKSFNETGGVSRGDLGVFATNDRSLARSYVRKGRAKDITSADLLSDEQIDDGDKPTTSGIYAVFMNLRDPREVNFEGASWDGSRSEQWTVELGGEQQYDHDGRGYFSKEEADDFARTFASPEEIEEKGSDAGEDYVVAADDHYEDTDSVVRDARRSKQDGAIIREVMDDGGGSGGAYDPADVYVAFDPNDVKSATLNSGKFNPSDSDITRSVDRSEEPGFKTWSHGNTLVRMGDRHTFKAGQPVVVEAVHGTLADFTAFDPARADLEADWGPGIYASSSSADTNRNYANTDGADHVNKIERRAEQIADVQRDEGNDITDAQAKQMARDEVQSNDGASMPLYMRFDNPVVAGGKNETFFDYERTYNEDRDLLDEGGTLTDLLMELQSIESDYHDMNYGKLVDDIMSKAQDNDGISASDLHKIFGESEGVIYATDDDGTMANGQILARALQGIGHDGVIDTAVSKRFKTMKLKSNDVHYIAFEPTQVKSRIGNNGDFSEDSADITRSAARESESLDALPAAKVDRLTSAATRGERITGTRASISADEKMAIKFSSEITGVPEKEITRQVREHKLASPPAQGWAPLVFNRAKIDQGKVVYDYQKVPYDFSTKDGRALKTDTPDYTKRVQAVGKAMADEVRRVQQRAEAGDKNAQNILAQAGWYKAMRARLRHEFGGLGDLFADLLGATSPNTPVRDNWNNAVDSLRRASRGDFDALMPAWENWASAVDEQETALRAWFNEQQALGKSKIEIKASPGYQSRVDALAKARELPDSLLPTKENGKKYGFNGRNVARAMVDLWRTVRDADPDVGRGATAPKALNFSGNLIGFRERATIDVWAARMLQRLAGGKRVPSAAETGVAGAMRSDGTTTLQFGFGQDVFSDAVKRIRSDAEMKANPTLAKINDDDLQAVVWFIEKELWTVNNWTNAAGEGGSFELEASLTGAADQGKIRALRKTADSSLSTPAAKAAARAELAAMEKTVDRYVGGLSIQESVDNQGRDLVPTNVDMARLGNEIRTSIYEGDDGATVLASKALPTEGRYGAPERSLDLEVVARDNYDPTPLWRTMMEKARATGQDSTFLSRVLRDDEGFDPLVHRPGVEIYFQEAASGPKLEAALEGLRKEGVEFLTVIVDGRRMTPAREGAMPPAVGVRLQYVPEFEQRYGMDDLSSLTDEQLTTTIKAKADALEDIAFRVAAEVEGVSFAGRFWYETQVAFSHEYQEKLDGIATGLPQGESRPAGSQARWQGQSVREGLASADQQSREAAVTESGRDAGVGGDALGAAGQQRAAGEASSVALDSRPEQGTRGTSLEGLPADVRVDGRLIHFGGFKPAQDAARAYAERAGIPYDPPSVYARVDPARATRIADAFEAMKHTPNDRTVKAAYDAMIRETEAQFQAMLDTGLKVEFITGDDPYGNPRNAILDVTRNNHLWVLPTDIAFGDESYRSSDHPMLRPTKFEISGRPALANDLFRAVHDYFGHIAEGVGFRADGEENAWRKHAAMYTPAARRALTTETRGQNSWVNYGPYADFNRTANGVETQYAPQKVGLMPEWTSEDGRDDASAATQSLDRNVQIREVDDGFDAYVGDERVGRLRDNLPRGAAEAINENANVDIVKVEKGYQGQGIGAALYKAFFDKHGGRVLPSGKTTPDAWKVWKRDYPQKVEDFVNAEGARIRSGADAGLVLGNITDPEIRSRVAAAGGDIIRSMDRPVFYSQLELALGEVPPRLATQAAPQWALWLQANAGKLGVKKDELEWSGILDYLKTRGKDKVTAEELQAYMRENGVQVDETTLRSPLTPGSTDKALDAWVDSAVESNSTYEAINAGESWSQIRAKAVADGEQEVIDIIDRQEADPVKYGTYTVPGGENYREVLITLPDAREQLAEKMRAKYPEWTGAKSHADVMSKEDSAALDAAHGGSYKSSHWEQPNIAAHLRIDDRTDADGKRVLFIGELQSDWGQHGKKKGFKSSDPGLTGAEEQRFQGLLEDGRRNLSGERLAEFEKLLRRRDAAAEDRLLPPSAPFVTDTKSWVALAMKRALVEAARNGYDKVAFINGQQAADLYDLSQHIDRIDHNDNGDGTYGVSAIKDGKEIFSKEAVPESELDDIVGKEVAAKIVAGEGDTDGGKVDRWEPDNSSIYNTDEDEASDEPVVRSLSGLDLKVGGEGMRTFYDQIVPQVARDLAKKLGGKVVDVQLGKSDGKSRFQVLDENGQDDGLPSFESEGQAIDWVDGADGEYTVEKMGAASISDAQFGIEITSAMRSALDGGAAMFSKDRPLKDMDLIRGYKVGDLLKSSKKVSWWDKTVGSMFNMAEKNPEFKKVYDAIQTFISDTSRFATRAADMAPTVLPKLETLADIGKTPLSPQDTAKLQGPVFEGTLNYTRDKSGKPVKTNDVGLAGIVWKPEELKSMWGLTGEQQADGSWSGQIGLYKEVRRAINKSVADLAISDMLHYAGKDAEAVRAQALEMNTVKEVATLLEDHLATLALANPGRADVLQNTAKVINEKANAAQGLIAKGYAPLTRFGDHTVYVTRKNGDDVEQVYFGMYETAREANKAERAFRAEFKDDPDVDIKTGTMSKESYKLFSGVTPDTLSLFASEIGIEESGDAQRDQVFQEMLKLTKTNRSAMKRLIERKGVNGFSEDVGRVLAGFVYSNARQASTNLHAGTISKNANDITDGDVKDHAIKLAQYVNNPQEEAQALRGLLFVNYIGGSVASALVNLTQSATTTWPVLSQHFGVGKATSGMAKALEVARKGAGADADLAAAMKRAEQDGITAPQETHSLQAQAAGRATLQGGDGTKLGNTLAKASNALSKIQLVWGKMFGWAEQVNRKVAFAAAYSLAREKGMADPYGFASKIVAETQYTQNKGNAMPWSRGAVGATIFTFRKFMIFYLEGLARMWGAGPEGKKAFALSLAVLFLVAGSGGLPFVEDLDDLIDAFAQRVLNKSWSTKQERKEFFAKIIGDAGAEFISSGVSGIPGAPIDVSGRMGLGNIIPGTGLLVKKRDHSRDVAEIAGAGGDFITKLVTAAGQVAQGNFSGAAEQAAPIALANVFKAVDMARMGQYRDYKGRKVIDVDLSEAILKGIGFQSAAVKNVQEATATQRQLIDLNKIRETEIADMWAKGRIERNADLVDKAKQQLKDWNESNPSSPISIDANQISKRVQEANKSKAQRIAATAPKEIRKDVKQELEREGAR